jgi:MYXO-CTERM domain-containing protein
VTASTPPGADRGAATITTTTGASSSTTATSSAEGEGDASAEAASARPVARRIGSDDDGGGGPSPATVAAFVAVLGVLGALTLRARRRRSVPPAS